MSEQKLSVSNIGGGFSDTRYSRTASDAGITYIANVPRNKDSDWLRPDERYLLGVRNSDGHDVFSLTPHSLSPQQQSDAIATHSSRPHSTISETSTRSTSTVCEGDGVSLSEQIVPFGLGISPGRRTKQSTSPCIFSKTSEPASKKPDVNWKSPDAEWRVKPMSAFTAFQTEISSSGKKSLDTEDDSLSLVSTVSGSGIEFFRKFVQRKGSNCKDCEEQFRREVLIDRLVTDSQNIKDRQKKISRGSSHYRSNSSQYRPDSHLESEATDSLTVNSGVQSSLGVITSIEERAKTCVSRCKSHRQSEARDTKEDTLSRTSGLSRQSSFNSSISGSGLLFLRNYLKKKKSKCKTGTEIDPKDISAFNIVPVPYPPPSDFYGPVFLDAGEHTAYSVSDMSSERRQSVCSTVADLLNEDFDCDDSELRNLDWGEWDEPLPDDISYDDLVSVISESFYSDDPELADLCDLDWEGRNTVVANDTLIVTPCEGCLEEEDEQTEHETEKLNEELPGKQEDEVADDLTTDTFTKDAVAVDKLLDQETTSRSRYGSYKSSTFLQDLEAELELPPMTPVSDEKEEAVRAISRTIRSYIRTGSNSSYGTDRAMSRLSAPTEEVVVAGASPALSDYLPELAPAEVTSPVPYCRPLSQLLEYDHTPSSCISYSPDCGTPLVSGSHTPSTVTSTRSSRNSTILTARPSSYCAQKENSVYEHRVRGASLYPHTNYSATPPSPAPHRPRRYMRHSSSNSTDSGCPLLEDKVASLSPTPSPANIDTLSSNRNKLASFWERSVCVGASSSEVPLAWLSDTRPRSVSCFQPFGSDTSLSVATCERVSHFLDVTRRAAAEKRPGKKVERKHRASTGSSDCSDLLVSEKPLSPPKEESLVEYLV